MRRVTSTIDPETRHPHARYAFLLRPRWLVFGLVALLAAGTMVGLGRWQLSRYHERSAINARIDNAATAPPRPVTDIMAAGAAPTADQEWTRVTVTGRYDQDHEVLARGRTVLDRVGFEVITPLVLADGTAVLVDRGWVAPAPGGAVAHPTVPPAPDGEVTVVGRVRRPESGAAEPTRRAGRLEVRRIDPARFAGAVPHRLLGGYVTLDAQTPPADRAFTPIPVQHENAGQNLGYVVQWWLFATLTLVGFGWLARREAYRSANRRPRDRAAEPADITGG